MGRIVGLVEEEGEMWLKKCEEMSKGEKFSFFPNGKIFLEHGETANNSVNWKNIRNQHVHAPL